MLKRFVATGLTVFGLAAGGAALAGSASADTELQTTAAAQRPAQAGLKWPLLERGKTGSNVVLVKQLLTFRGIKADVRSPYFDEATVKAVKTYQVKFVAGKKGKKADGRVDSVTWMDLAARHQVKLGDKNSCVAGLQGALNDDIIAGHGDESQFIPITGKFGPLTKTALNNFQRSHGLTPGNVVTVNTWHKLVEATRGIQVPANNVQMPANDAQTPANDVQVTGDDGSESIGE
ncbi:peptidoglycan-binding protein [Actinomadura sp. 6N118]|uniref:peptidoglycan-binding domain-containing protein n=1 Tax=Actinomadura sp. 6N118 TaxID=3375151 RepID=UPI0037A60F76